MSVWSCIRSCYTRMGVEFDIRSPPLSRMEVTGKTSDCLPLPASLLHFAFYLQYTKKYVANCASFKDAQFHGNMDMSICSMDISMEQFLDPFPSHCSKLKPIPRANAVSYPSTGFIKFLESWYMILCTKRRQIGNICGHAIYGIDDTQLLTIAHPSVQSDLANSRVEVRSAPVSARSSASTGGDSPLSMEIATSVCESV